MTLDVQLLGQGIAVTAAIAAIGGAIRRPSLESAETAAFLTAYAALAFFSVDLPLTMFLFVSLASAVAPYLIVRLAGHLRPVPRWLRVVLFIGMLYMATLNAVYVAVIFRFEGTVGTQPAPPALLGLLQVAYVVTGQAYAAGVFIGGAITATGARQWRLRLAAAGSILTFTAVAAAVVSVYSTTEPGAPPRLDNPFGASFYMLSALASLAYLAAFAPPPWLRQLWRLAELQRFLRETSAIAIGERGHEALEALVGAAVRASGATAGVVLTADALRSPADPAIVPAEAVRAWQSGVAAVGPHVIAIPVQTGERRFGVLTVSFRRRSLFAADDAAVLTLMSESTAIALANDELFREQRDLNERLRAQGEALDRAGQEKGELLEELRTLNAGLQQTVQEHVREIERSRMLRRYLPQQVADAVIASGDESLLQTHRREITVVFGDLRGFTAFAETGEPEVVMSVLGEYHGAVGEFISRYAGTLEQFSGDGWMVYFNDPLPVPDHTAQAVRMSIALRERIGELARRWRRHGHELDFGIGIAIGYATLGTIGFEGRHDYGAIGTVANLASRLSDEAKGGQILVTQRVDALVEEIAETQPVGEFHLKGFLKPVAAFNVVGLKKAAEPT